MVKVVELVEDAGLLPKLKKFFPHQTLRRFQADMANRVYESLSAGSRSVLLEGPTGLGKRPEDEPISSV